MPYINARIRVGRNLHAQTQFCLCTVQHKVNRGTIQGSLNCGRCSALGEGTVLVTISQGSASRRPGGGKVQVPETSFGRLWTEHNLFDPPTGSPLLTNSPQTCSEPRGNVQSTSATRSSTRSSISWRARACSCPWLGGPANALVRFSASTLFPQIPVAGPNYPKLLGCCWTCSCSLLLLLDPPACVAANWRIHPAERGAPQVPSFAPVFPITSHDLLAATFWARRILSLVLPRRSVLLSFPKPFFSLLPPFFSSDLVTLVNLRFPLPSFSAPVFFLLGTTQQRVGSTESIKQRACSSLLSLAHSFVSGGRSLR
ncbi:hypothetical protein VTG60DRAFT_1550 [Thermothelomyces hinnuleus]